ncbi:MAG: acyltransferase family protein, partial [Lachnospiraceae bacterium]|nr:acyltransferase family protein [Lachnospiraceae bacterium]
TLDAYSVTIEILIGRYHLWFLPMMVGIYLILPVLRPFLKEKNEQLVQYLIFLFFVLKILRDTIVALDMDYAWTIITNIMQPDLITTYVGYFLLGYYLYHFEGSKLRNRLIYAGALCSVILAPVCSILLSEHWQKPVSEIYDSFSIFTFLISATLFLFFKEHVAKHTFSEKSRRVIEEISADTLGIYLLHVAILEIAARYGLTTNSLPAVISVPLLSIGNFAIGLILAAILRRIPKIGRFIC